MRKNKFSQSVSKKKFKIKDGVEFETESQRLARILDTKHLKTRPVRSLTALGTYYDDSDDDTDENEDEASNAERLNNPDILAKKFLVRTEKLRNQKRVVCSMFNKAMANEERSRKFLTNSFEKSLKSKLFKEKTNDSNKDKRSHSSANGSSKFKSNSNTNNKPSFESTKQIRINLAKCLKKKYSNT